jgi:hypothetical protein
MSAANRQFYQQSQPGIRWFVGSTAAHSQRWSEGEPALNCTVTPFLGTAIACHSTLEVEMVSGQHNARPRRHHRRGGGYVPGQIVSDAGDVLMTQEPNEDAVPAKYAASRVMTAANRRSSQQHQPGSARWQCALQRTVSVLQPQWSEGERAFTVHRSRNRYGLEAAHENAQRHRQLSGHGRFYGTSG